jgi:hydroxyacylglutathione hydrolase
LKQQLKLQAHLFSIPEKVSDFSKGFIPQSVNIGIDGDFAPWVGAMIADVKQPLLLVCDAGREEEVVTRLSRVGFDNVLGYLHNGVNAWQEAGFEIDTVNRITASDFNSQLKVGESMVVDVRKESEYEAEHVEEAYSRPLASINDWIKEINPKHHFFLHCAGGYRSMIAASILQARGYRNFSEIEGGFKSIAETDIPKSDFVCQSKVLNA